jgi:hypothetical protein
MGARVMIASRHEVLNEMAQNIPKVMAFHLKGNVEEDNAELTSYSGFEKADMD